MHNFFKEVSQVLTTLDKRKLFVVGGFNLNLTLGKYKESVFEISLVLARTSEFSTTFI